MITQGGSSSAAQATGDLIDVRLTSISFAAEGIHLFEVRPVGGGRLPSCDAGSHVDLHLPNGLVRPYSLMYPGHEPDRYVVGVRRDAGGLGGSTFMHDALRVGSLLRVGQPRNAFPLDEQAVRTVLLAGGIGITPILSMVRRLEALGREWSLHYAVRTRADAAFVEELYRHGDRFHLHCDDEAGHVFRMDEVIGRAPRDAHLYCCGPAPMLAAFEAATGGRPPEQVHLERFTAAPVPLRQAFQVHLARSGLCIDVEPGQSILDAVLNAGVDCSYACMQGTCGSCEVRVLEGVPEHRDGLLPKARRLEERTMLICCSGSRSPSLVLDL
jgi:vanillate O-demethylase ferredoxin subunit